MDQLQDSLNAMINWFLDDRSLALDTEGEHRPQDIAKHLSSVYRIINNEGSEMEQQFVGQFKGQSPISEYVKYELYPYVSRFFLHGSYATGDFIKGWSDVDTFAVIPSDVMESPARLVKLREKSIRLKEMFYDICKFQHHGIIYVTEKDLNNYDYMPPIVLKRAKDFIPAGPICYRLRRDKRNALDNLRGRQRVVREALKTGEYKHHPYKGVGLKTRFRNADNGMYQLHCFLAYVMLVPALFLEAVGRPCHKKESFELARPYIDYTLIDKASNIRAGWVGNKGNVIPLWVQDILGPYYIEEFSTLIDSVIGRVERVQLSQTSTGR